MIARLAATVAMALLAGTVFAADSYTVAAGATVTIDEQNMCRKVTNPAGAPGTRWISTKTAAEWQSFIDHPNGLTMAACPVPCGGTSVGGYCWYFGAMSASCDTVCATHGGCNLAGTRDYAGSGGTLANCTSVMSAISPQPPYQSSEQASGGIGCAALVITTSAVAALRDTNETTCASSLLGMNRACVCNN